MLIALITILLLGGGDSAVLDFVSYMRDSVDEVVEDDERRNDATATLKEMKSSPTLTSRRTERPSRHCWVKSRSWRRMSRPRRLSGATTTAQPSPTTSR